MCGELDWCLAFLSGRFPPLGFEPRPHSPAPRRPECPPRLSRHRRFPFPVQLGFLGRPSPEPTTRLCTRNSESSQSFWDKQTTSSAAAAATTPQQHEPSGERGRKREKNPQQREMLVSRAFQQCVFFFFAGLFVGGSVCCFSPHTINQHQTSR